MNEEETVLTMHSWSKEAMAECAISDKPLVYPLETTDLWGEAARQRKPIITNDYTAQNPLKKGLPEGHVKLSRHMNVPILDGGHVVIVAGVGNKDKDYDESDVRQLTLLMEGMWMLLQRQRVQTELQLHRNHLEQLVAERTAELAKANTDLVLFRKLAEASGQGFGIASLNGQIVYVNPAMCRLLGEEKPEDIVGKHLSVYFSEPYMHKRAEEIVPEILRAGHWQGETVIARHGRSIAVLQGSFVVRDEQGKPACIATVMADITERKRAEEALRQSRDELQVIYDSVVDGIIIVDAETVKLVRANAACSRMSGYTDEELYALSPAKIHPPEVLPAVLQRLEAVKKGSVVRTNDSPFLRKDGSILYVDAIVRPIYYNDRPCWISFFHDVTERKHAQEALEREHRTLRHLLQSSDHERQLIAYEIHDGLAQYLTGAIMQFETYHHSKETKPKDAAKAYEAGMTVLRQGLSEARRLIAGVRPLILDDSGVIAAIGHLMNEERLHKGPKIQFQSDVAFDRLVPILENAIYRIVQEGLTNACRHSKSKRVRVELVQHDDKLRIKIQDWGVGFNLSDVEDDCFGLASIRERARLLGGNTVVESTPGQGTCITVELPLVLRE
jgi:PAS domain S-box-containing protein